jgi:hypothetical protein
MGPRLEDGWKKIGVTCPAGRRSLWVRWFARELEAENRLPTQVTAIELRAGREGDDAEVRIERGELDEAKFEALLDVMMAANYAAELGDEEALRLKTKPRTPRR